MNLYVPCFSGELGWELVNYAQHVNFRVLDGAYERVMVSVRPGRQSIYPMATDFQLVDMPNERSNGNGGYPMSKVDQRNIERLGKTIEVVDWEKIRMNRYGLSPDRKAFLYEPSQRAIDRMSQFVTEKSVILCVRGRSLSPVKNWPESCWLELIDGIKALGFDPVITGVPGLVNLKSANCSNLLGKTSIGDMIALFSVARLAVGQSTGTMHLASLCRIPHVVWGPEKIRNRYETEWNPFSCEVKYYVGECLTDAGKQTGFDCKPSTVLAGISEILK